MSKSYKLPRAVVEDFATACQKAGVKQGPQLVKLMVQYINEQKKDY